MNTPIILPASDENIALAITDLLADKPVAFPTETVYGLGGCAFSNQAVLNIYNMKKRPTNNPLILHYSALTNGTFNLVQCIKLIEKDFNINSLFLSLLEKFSPGPLTFILNKKAGCKIAPLAAAFLNRQALRIPNHPVALKLIAKLGQPLAAPSANISNKLSPTAANHVALSFPNENLLILDGGPCEYGLESTVIDVSDPKNVYIYRHGSISVEQLIEAGIEPKNLENSAKQILSPGMLHKHYSPNAKLRLNAQEVLPQEALLAFGEISISLPENTLVFNLSKNADLIEAAHNLFKMLWDFDTLKIPKIAVMPIPERGIGVAINERLRKAAV